MEKCSQVGKSIFSDIKKGKAKQKQNQSNKKTYFQENKFLKRLYITKWFTCMRRTG